MPDTVIKVQNLSKQYRIGARERYRTFRETLVEAAKAPLKGIGSLFSCESSLVTRHSETIWALKDVSFEVKQGEVVGIIGRNGAGKSTILKILSKITEPTEGRIELRGRVGSLLEVGTGFHPELTGHENIYLYGAILGMDRWEVTRKFDEIVAFAELEKFIDTPVKRYSSGMYMRLAFAVAAYLEPEILLVDEVLAVGDAAFQKKCLGKMGEVSRGGRTVLFVSHNMAAVEHLCTAGIVLDGGSVVHIGSQTDAITKYLTILSQKTISLRHRTDRMGSGEVRVVGIEIKDANGNTVDSVPCGQDAYIYLCYEAQPDFRRRSVIASIACKTVLDAPVFLHHNRMTRDDFGELPEKGAFVCHLKSLPLPPATYRIAFSIISSGSYLDYIEDAAELSVIEGDFFGSAEVPPISHGVCLVEGDWHLEPKAAFHWSEAET
jgi:lipopolysaccharide transport system ATP-binding protein